MTPENRQRRVARVLTVSLGAMLAALGGYLLWIQAFSSEKLSGLAFKQQHMFVPLIPVRGVIYDTRMRVLACSLDTQSVFADPKVVRDPGETAAQVAPLLGLPPDEVLEKIVAELQK